MFTDAAELNNVFTEWVEEHPAHPDAKDYGSPPDVLPDGRKSLFNAEQLREVGGRRPQSEMTEIRVAVHDLHTAVERWRQLLGYEFRKEPDEVQSATTVVPAGRTSITLVQSQNDEGEGLFGATIQVSDLAAELRRLQSATVPHSLQLDSAGAPSQIRIAPEFLNSFEICLIAGSQNRSQNL